MLFVVDTARALPLVAWSSSVEQVTMQWKVDWHSYWGVVDVVVVVAAVMASEWSDLMVADLERRVGHSRTH